MTLFNSLTAESPVRPVSLSHGAIVMPMEVPGLRILARMWPDTHSIEFSYSQVSLNSYRGKLRVEDHWIPFARLHLPFPADPVRIDADPEGFAADVVAFTRSAFITRPLTFARDNEVEVRSVLRDLRVALDLFEIELGICTPKYAGGCRLNGSGWDDEEECDREIDDELEPWEDLIISWFRPEGWVIGTECFGDASPHDHHLIEPPRNPLGKPTPDPTPTERAAARARLDTWLASVEPVVGSDATAAARDLLDKGILQRRSDP